MHSSQESIRVFVINCIYANIMRITNNKEKRKSHRATTNQLWYEKFFILFNLLFVSFNYGRYNIFDYVLNLFFASDKNTKFLARS